jgi:ferrous-iron efflux pump FieF
MVLSVAATGGLVWFQRRVARATGSKVVAADSLHYLSDLLPAAGGIVALGASALFGVVMLDSLFSLVAAAVLMRGAWKIGGSAWAALMDRAAPADVERRIAETVAGFPEIRGFHDLKTRVSGTRTFVQLHIELDGQQSLYEAHEIGARLRLRILEAVPGSEVLVHKDPVMPDGSVR